MDESEKWEHAPRLPLGDLYSGLCRARGEETVEPEESVQREVCNCGYARGRCDRFPAEAVDAVRFSVVGEVNGVLRLIHIEERDHAPAGYGEVEYRLEENGFAPAFGGEVLTAQARAFVESYLRRASLAPRASESIQL